MGDHKKPDDSGKDDGLPGRPWSPPDEDTHSDGGPPKGGGKHGK
ncbi:MULTISPECIES: hypothetical protein [Streptomyces]